MKQVFAETFKLRLSKYYLTGERRGEIEYIVNGDPSPACEYIDCLLYHDGIVLYNPVNCLLMSFIL